MSQSVSARSGGLTVLLFALALVAAGCGAFARVQGTGPVTSETRQVAAFSRVDAGWGIPVRIEVGPAAPLQVKAQANILPIIATTVEGGTLRVRATKEFFSSGSIEVVIVTPSLDAISLSGGSQGSVSGVETARLDISLEGGAGLTASGSATAVALTSSGGSEAHLADLSARTVSLELSGGASATVTASDEVTGSASGGAHATVRGPARLNVEASGGGEVGRE